MSVRGWFKVQYGNPKAHVPQLDVRFEFPATGVSAIFGESGSGKTTLLRCIAGLHLTPEGALTVGDSIWQQGRKRLPVHRRSVGYVFQEPSLFPHLTAAANLEFATRRARRAQTGVAAADAIELMGIGPLLQRYPTALSGGERQRVAIVRALMSRPALLLMDEPLAALDQGRKQDILPYLERIRHELAIPVLYVSHSPDEIARLADYLMVLKQGRVVAQGPLQTVLADIQHPIPLGEDAGVVLDATVKARDSRWHLSQVEFAGGSLWVRDNDDPIGAEVRLRILARDVSLALADYDSTSILNRLPATLVEVVPDQHPAMVLARVKVGSTPFVARTTARSFNNLNLQSGDPLWIQIKSVALIR